VIFSGVWRTQAFYNKGEVMKQARHLNVIAIAALILLLTFLLIFSSITGSGAPRARAAASSYSGVLEDLQKDPEFNVAEYPMIYKDYSIKVIQIAESSAGELFIYTYQPGGQINNLRASSINIAREANGSNDLSFKNYTLKYLNSFDVFYKYAVQNFELKTDTVRYYNISNILRPFDDYIDEEPADGYISEVPFSVAQLWTVKTVGDDITYTMETSEVITIMQKVVGYCIYDDGLKLGWGTMEGITKAYFVAFDTDRPIDKLISADLTFYATRVQCKICCNDKHEDHSLFYDFHDPEYIDFGTGVYNNEPLTITDKQTWGNQGGGNVRPATKFLRKRIRSTSEFIADENNKDYELYTGNSLNGTKWVLNFYEAQDKYKVDNVWLSFIPGVSSIKGVADGEAELNNVYDVSILRLEFETDGVTYNLGVVDNKQTGGDKPFNEYIGDDENFWTWLADLLGVSTKKAKIIFWVAVGLIVLAIALPVLSALFPPFGAVLKTILYGFLWLIGKLLYGLWWLISKLLYGLWWLITLPFRAIAKAVRNRKSKPKKAKRASPKRSSRKKAGNNV